MKTSLIASLALAAALVPSLASAGSLTFDPAAGSNDPNFVAAPVNVNSANALAAKADAARYAEAAQAAKSDAIIGTHGSATGASVVTTFDPAARDNDPQFLNTFFNDGGANAAAAKADAARYAAAEQTLKSGAVVGTHGSDGYRVVTSFDPAARDNEPQFRSTVVFSN